MLTKLYVVTAIMGHPAARFYLYEIEAEKR